jgi:subtilisin family serine protease
MGFNMGFNKRDSRYLVLVGLLVAAVALWQFGTHDGANVNPLDDPDSSSVAAERAVRTASSVDSNAGRHAGANWGSGDFGQDATVYVDGQVMVRVDAPLLDALARRHGTSVARDIGISGYGALAVPADLDADAFARVLMDDPWVTDAAAIGIIRGAAQDEPTTVEDYQWHLEGAAQPTDPGAYGLSNVKVAVLDTGVAYEDHTDGMGVGTLATVGISDPWDFVNGDAAPYDDHQHGTHIASVIASQDVDGAGDATGIAPGVTLMPVKVLDGSNAGTELFLLDALAWALERDADVVNMSLSFAPGYTGSRALRDALDACWAAGIVMVAAAGNDGMGVAVWPAAHNDVIAVGAASMKNSNHTELADYSNDHPRVDLVAPGGAIGVDRDKDDVDDGILAQTIALNDPDISQYVLYAGTSQATAVVSGAVAYLLAEGVHPTRVRNVLQRTAGTPIGDLGFLYGTGAGTLDIQAALDSVLAEDMQPDTRQMYVALLPFLRWTDISHMAVEPVAQITVVDQDGALVSGAEVFGVWAGSTGNFFSCITDGDGECVVAGTATLADADDLVWSVETPTVVHGGMAYHPDSAIFADDDMAVILDAMGDEPEFDDALLAFLWPEGTEDGLGDLAEAWFVVDTGTGLGSCPLGILFPTRTLGTDYELSEFDLDLDGTGLGSCPLGTLLGRLLVINGGGLGSCPLGIICRFPFGGPGGGGLGSCPLGMPWRCLFGKGSTDNPAVTLEFDGEAILLGDTATSAAGLDGTSYGDALDAGGWITGEGDFAGASALRGSDTVTITPPAVGVAGSGSGAMTFSGP